MPRARVEVPQLENMVQTGKKKFVRYAEGAALYSLGLHTFQEIAKKANETVRKIRKNSVENTARNLSICDNLAAGVFFRILAGKKTIFKRKRHVSGQNHLH